MPNLAPIKVAHRAIQNANGDTTVTGELLFGIATQTDNALPTTALTVLGADANGAQLMPCANGIFNTWSLCATDSYITCI